MTEFLVSLVPSLGALFLLWIGLRAIFQADRRERAAMARFDAEYDRAQAQAGRGEAAAAAPPRDDAPDGSTAGGAPGAGPAAGA